MSDHLTPWHHINRFYHTTRKPIQLLVAYHADAAAASITLTTLLKACFVPFNLHPIMEYEEARDVIQRTSMAQDAEVLGDSAPVDELFVLIGLGAPISLRSFFDLRRHIVIVLDSYRPFLLENLRASDNDRLVVWGHDRIHQEVEQFFQEQRRRELARAQRRRRRRMRRNQRRLRAYGEAAANDDDAGEDEESELSSGSSDDDDDDGLETQDDMTPSQSQEGIDWMNEDVPENLEQLYYAAECGGKSCALEVYDLAILLNRVKEAVLWHAAVGVCDLFTRRLIDYGTYLVEMRRLHNEVTLRKGIRRGPLDDVTEETVNRHHKIASSNTMQLINFEEDQLFLLRHYSLWGAMWYHPVVASLLSLHHVEDGTGALRQLLARCGVSAKLAQQPWGEIPDDVKTEALRLVHHELKQALRTRGSFIKSPTRIRCVARTTGYSVEVSTFDVCTLFTALLAKVPPSDMNTEEASEALMKEKLHEFRREQFWRAHDVIDADPNSKLFINAVQEAQMLQESVATATSALMQPGMIQSTKGIHYAQPSDPRNASTALETFGCPFRLSVLAERMLIALTVERGLGKYTREVRPVLLFCPVPRLIGPGMEQQPQQQQMVQTEETFIVLFAHEGPTMEGLSPVVPVARWNDCVTNTEDFLVPPLRDFIRRDTVVIDGRESTAHLAEMLHLHSLTGTF